MNGDSTTLTLQVQTHSAAETEHIAARVASSLRPGDCLALEGELGAGKTCFVRGLAQGLGIDPSHVSSPTFVIAHEYEGKETGTPLIHIDAYRIASMDDLESIGFSDMLAANDSIIAIEWPSRIAAAIPASRIDVAIESLRETQRLIRIAARSDLRDELQNIGFKTQSASSAHQARCRTCCTTIDAGVRTFPFCSDRCRMADLGGWFRGGYKLSRPMQADDELSD